MKITFNKATIHDLNLIYSFMLKQANDERGFMNNLDKKEKKDLFYTKSEVKNIISSKNNYLVIAKSNNIPLGCGLAKIEKTPKWNKYSKQGYMGMLYVDKKYRNKGVAKALQIHRMNWLNSNGVRYLTCAVLSNNKQSIKLLTKQGFKPRLVMMYKEIK